MARGDNLVLRVFSRVEGDAVILDVLHTQRKITLTIVKIILKKILFQFFLHTYIYNYNRTNSGE